MEIRQLRYFVAIADAGAITRAASKLHIAQPALTRQIHDLEQELTVSLFERTKRGVQLTYPGKCFLKRVRQLLADVEEAQNATRNAKKGKVSSLTIGLAEPFACHDVISRAIRKFRDKHPDVVLTAAVMNSREQLAAIREQRLSAGFVINPPHEEKGLECLEIVSDRVVLAVPASSPLALHKPKRLAELSREQFVWLPRKVHPSYYDEVMDTCKQCGLEPNIVEEGSNSIANLSLVAAGLGCTFAPFEARWRKPKNVVIVPLKEMDVTVTLELVWHRQNRNGALLDFVETLDEERSAAPKIKMRKPRSKP